jgi:dihydroorotase
MILKNGRIIDPKNNIDGVGDVEIVDGKIVRVTLTNGSLSPADAVGIEEESGCPPEGKGGDRGLIDCTGKVICPGLIDIHVHLRVPGQEYKEDVPRASGARRRAASRR